MIVSKREMNFPAILDMDDKGQVQEIRGHTFMGSMALPR